MKIFEVEFVYDDYDKREANGVGSRNNPFRVRMMYPKDREYNKDYWSLNHIVIKDEFRRLYNPTINGSTYEKRYWVHRIRRVR